MNAGGLHSRDDSDRAGGVVEYGLADGAEEEAGESAAASGADNDELCLAAGIDQCLAGTAVLDSSERRVSDVWEPLRSGGWITAMDLACQIPVADFPHGSDPLRRVGRQTGADPHAAQDR
jgi:hypothetical protein